jgi:hypothetical protein
MIPQATKRPPTTSKNGPIAGRAIACNHPLVFSQVRAQTAGGSLSALFVNVNYAR